MDSNAEHVKHMTELLQQKTSGHITVSGLSKCTMMQSAAFVQSLLLAAQLDAKQMSKDASHCKAADAVYVTAILKV
jgi:hypothetical protein